MHDRANAGPRTGTRAAKLFRLALFCFAALAFLNAQAFCAPGDITNTARITFNGGVEIYTNQVTDTPEAVVDCSVSKSADKPTPMEGETVTYTITAENSGGSTATGVVVTDTIPAGITLAGSDPSYDSLAGGVATWNIGDIAPGGRATITVYAVVDDDNPYAGTTVTNTAQVSCDQFDADASNNTASADILIRTPASIEFLRYAPSVSGAQDVNFSITAYSPSGSHSGPFVDMGPPTVPGGSGPIDLGSPVPVIAADLYHDGEPLFVRVTDRDQNLDPAVVETIVITLESQADSGTDTEVVRLTETGPDTGVFTGYIMSASGDNGAVGNGTLGARISSDVSATYHDALDGPQGTVSTSAVIDPYGVVFDSLTGLPVNGAVVSLVSIGPGGESPAVVYGDDGVSSFPSTVVSGGTTTDGSGATYDFPDGAFRFPVLSPGEYRIDVTPPDGYRAPSAVPDSVLQGLPGAPFALVTGSRGESFTVDGGPLFRVDIPVDPTTNALYLAKKAGRDRAAPGDFIPYNLSVENTSDVSVTGIVVTDRLPAGFRYRKGSAKRDGSAASDPIVSSDGRTLTFTVGTLAAGAKASIDYVAQVSAGAHTGKAVNRAVATGSNASSLPATATVEVTEDLLRSKCIIVGRVVADNCENDPEKENDGVEGVRIYLEDGAFAVTDEDGMYHFEGVEPGTHVVQLDTATLPEMYEPALCVENSRFANTPFSQFVDLQGGTMWRADFHVRSRPRERGEIRLRLESIRAGGTILYDAYLSGGTVPVSNVRFTLLLPDGVRYIEGTSEMDGGQISPSVMGGVLTYRLGDMPRVWRRHITLKADIRTIFTPKDEAALVTKGLLTFDTPAAKNRRTPLVETKTPVRFKDEITLDASARPLFESFSDELTGYGKQQLVKVKKQLEGRRVRSIVVTGHTDALKIRPRSRHIFANNDELSLARARSVGNYLIELLGLSPEMVKAAGMGARKPVATNLTEAGRAKNRRVTITILSDAISNDTAVADDSVRVETFGARPGERVEEVPAPGASVGAGETAPQIDAAFVNALDELSASMAWVWPKEGYLPASPGVQVAIAHRPGVFPRLILNGEPVSTRNYEKTVTNRQRSVSVSLWRGVDLAEGDNVLVAVAGGNDGSDEFRITRKIHYSGPPVSARLVPERSLLVADGVTVPVIAVRLTDRDGYPARKGVVGKFWVNPPYMPQPKADGLQRSPLSGEQAGRSDFTVEDDGMVFIRLSPSAQSGRAVVNLLLMEGEKSVEAWLAPKEREWVLVGLAEGTVGYNTLSGHAENLAASGAEDKIYQDGRLAFFAKGRIKGEWLLTIAADTTREKAAGDDELFRTIDPDTYYTLYGDATEQGYEAASKKKLYIKLEKRQFYALFGDYSTDLTVTELSRYTRNGTGFKSEYNGENFSYTAFASSTDKGFVKDEIRGNGTSGLYRLSRSDIVVNSETVTIETRDRFKSEKILSSRTLMRHVDYSIDYSTGELYFREPVFSRDENLNPVYIVVDYETEGGGLKSGMNYGGRGAVKLAGGRAEVGATHVHEGPDGAKGDLTGVDARVNLGAGTTLRAEYAKSSRQDGSATVDGDAYLAEITHQSERLSGRLYVREEETGFGLGHQRASEEGMRKIGGEGTLRVTSSLNADAEAYRHENLATGARRDVGELGMSYASGGSTFHAGVRHAEDRFADGTVNRSDQAIAGASTKAADGRMTLRVEHEQSIGKDHDASADFPTRTMLGADYKVSDRASLFAEQEFTSGRDEDTNQTRLGLKTEPWSGGALSSTLGREYNEYGARLFATMGLLQKWRINDLWSMDAGLDHSRTLKDPGADPLNPAVPPAYGTSDDNDFTAVSMGATYNPETWTWNGRAEFRNSETDDRWGLATAVYGEPVDGIGLSCGATIFVTDSKAGSDTTDGAVRFGFVHRPKHARWIVLDKLEFIYEDETGGASSYKSRRIINNINANFMPDERWQLSLQYGAKYVLDTINNDEYSGYTDLAGIEARYDVTERFDLGVYGSVLHTWATSQLDYRTGVSIGCDISRNMWLSLGYNFAGFSDRDFSAADFTAKGPFVQFRMKFDQKSVKEAARMLSGNQ